MSGGRGGGGGRGRGRAPPTGARLMLQRSAQEAGLDGSNLRSLQDITKPQLFPDYNWHSSGQLLGDAPPESTQAQKRSPSTIYLINKSREMHHRFQTSPHYVRPTQEVDVVRYGKRPRPVEPDVAVLEDMGKKVAQAKYLPPELLQKTGIALLSMKELNASDSLGPSKVLTLEELATQELERRRREAATAEGEDGDGDENSDDAQEQDEEEEEVADYTTNYYESEDESDGGGDGGEATF
jgi:hypothetical protein